MKAAVVRVQGGPEHLAFETGFPDPEPGEGDVVLAVKACSLNYHDVFTRRGMPGIKVPLPIIMGLDVAGELPAVCSRSAGASRPARRRAGGAQRARVASGRANWRESSMVHQTLD